MAIASDRAVLAHNINRVTTIIAEATTLLAELQLQCSPHYFEKRRCIHCGVKNADSLNVIRLERGEKCG